MNNLKVTPVFLRNWKVSPEKRWVINRGGTRSSKTTSICQQLAVWLVTGQIREKQHIPTGNAAIVRKYKTTLESTVMRDFEKALDTCGLRRFVKVNNQRRQYRCGKRMVEFFGADDEQKIRGFAATITWLNEANELDWDLEVLQLKLRTEELMIIDFNPSDPYVWAREKLELGRAVTEDDVETIISTYRDNPYLSSAQVREIELLETEDLNYWRVYGLGEYGQVTGLVFPNIKIVEKMPENLKYRGFGMDFGYSNGITTLIECGFQNEKDVYFNQVFYQRGMTPQEMGEVMLSSGVGRFPVVADSAGEWAIEHLKSMRLNIFPAKKGPDSVTHGITLLNSYNLHVTQNSVDMLRERLKYMFRVDKSGRILNVPVDAFNHTWDAARYWAVTYLKRKSRLYLALPPAELEKLMADARP
jgi:phage terminase large subunit